jgi:hypothetical protein
MVDKLHAMLFTNLLAFKHQAIRLFGQNRKFSHVYWQGTVQFRVFEELHQNHHQI